MLESITNFNYDIIWIKVAYAFFGFGMSMVLPFNSLQMASMGLTNVDISLMFGIIPLRRHHAHCTIILQQA